MKETGWPQKLLNEYILFGRNGLKSLNHHICKCLKALHWCTEAQWCYWAMQFEMNFQSRKPRLIPSLYVHYSVDQIAECCLGHGMLIKQLLCVIACVGLWCCLIDRMRLASGQIIRLLLCTGDDGPWSWDQTGLLNCLQGFWSVQYLPEKWDKCYFMKYQQVDK